MPDGGMVGDFVEMTDVTPAENRERRKQGWIDKMPICPDCGTKLAADDNWTGTRKPRIACPNKKCSLRYQGIEPHVW